MILCCGEALIDMIPNEDGAFVPHAGGSVFNTAIGLGRQGIPVGLLSGVSTDLFGDILETTLTDSAVTSDDLIRSDRPTTLAFVKLVNGKASYAFYDENTAGRMLEVSALPTELPQGTRALFFGGISLAVEPCADTYAALLNRHAGEKTIMVDPNIRPSFIQDEARFRARMEGILAAANIIKISDEDLEWFDRSDRDLDLKAKALIARGADLVCLTLGSKGVRTFHKNGSMITASAPAKNVVDTVGAGDAFNAGLLTKLDRLGALGSTALSDLSDEKLSEALQFATEFAADTVTRAGSDPAWNFSLSE
ncbi:MAG: carbohydrate kinase [Pseudomonadota bacterium]